MAGLTDAFSRLLVLQFVQTFRKIFWRIDDSEVGYFENDRIGWGDSDATHLTGNFPIHTLQLTVDNDPFAF